MEIYSFSRESKKKSFVLVLKTKLGGFYYFYYATVSKLFGVAMV